MGFRCAIDAAMVRATAGARGGGMARRHKKSSSEDSGVGCLVMIALGAIVAAVGWVEDHPAAEGPTEAGAVLVLCFLLWVIVKQRRARARAPKPATLTLAGRGRKLLLDYEDADHEDTRREITVRRVDGFTTPAGFIPERLHAYCHLRHAERTFLVRRIQGAADAATGEVVADLAAWVAAHLRHEGN